MNTVNETDTYSEAVEALLRERLTGADREFCERIQRDGFTEPSEYDPETAFFAVAQKKHECARIRSLCLSHGVPLPN